MKIVQINSTCGIGSTGKICVSISELLTDNKIENYIFYASGKSDYPLGIKYMTDLEIKGHALASKIFGNYGFQTKAATKKLIAQLETISPDVVHLHNLHGHNVNLKLLFNYLRKRNIKIVWTFHDCWAFTAYCPHFSMVKCEKWKSGCFKCPQYKERSFFFDRSREIFDRKKKLFSNLDMTIVTPSQWLAELVRQSFVRKYPIHVINNGIDLSVFRPTKDNFRERYGIDDNKKIILGVAFGWGRKKGLDVFVHLAEVLDSSLFQIILVGTNAQVDSNLPSNILTIHRTSDQHELAEIYTAADLFVNPTREEVQGLVNIEANACGTPVLTFKTGGAPECICEISGSVVECDDITKLRQEIIRIVNEHPYSQEDCCKNASKFSNENKYNEYLALYKSLIAK